jgi:hypothetical protein
MLTANHRTTNPPWASQLEADAVLTGPPEPPIVPQTIAELTSPA